MASPAKGFKSENGKWFDTALEAWTEDLDQWLARSIENVAERGKIAKGIREDIENGNHLSAIIAGLKASLPQGEIADAIEQGDWRND